MNGEDRIRFRNPYGLVQGVMMSAYPRNAAELMYMHSRGWLYTNVPTITVCMCAGEIKPEQSALAMFSVAVKDSAREEKMLDAVKVSEALMGRFLKEIDHLDRCQLHVWCHGGHNRSGLLAGIWLHELNYDMDGDAVVDLIQASCPNALNNRRFREHIINRRRIMERASVSFEVGT